MALCAYYHKPARLDYLFFVGIGLNLALLKIFKIVLAHLQRLARQRNVRRARKRDKLLRHALCPQLLFCHELGIAAQQYVRAAACHVCGNCDSARLTRLRHDFCLKAVVFGVEYIVGNTRKLEHLAQFLRLFHGKRSHQHGLAALVAILYLCHHRAQLARNGLVNSVVFVLSYHGEVCGNHHNVQPVNGAELVLFGLCRTRHAGQLFVQAEIILKGDSGKRLVFALYADAFLCLDCLMQSVAVPPAYHGAAGKLVNDDYLAVGDNIVAVALHYIVCLERLLYVLDYVGVFHIGKALYVKVTLCLFRAGISDAHGLVLFVKDIIVFRPQRAYKPVCRDIDFRALAAVSGDNQRCARLVDEYGVNLVHDGKLERPLHKVVLTYDHVVAQVIKAKLVVCGIGYVA